jgi:hypothetical protein
VTSSTVCRTQHYTKLAQHYPDRYVAKLCNANYEIPRLQGQIQEQNDKLTALSPGSQGKAASSDKPTTDKPTADSKADCSSS